MSVATAVVSSRSLTGRRLQLPTIGWVGIAIVAGFATVAVAAPALTPYRPGELSGQPLEGPSLAHALGTNSVGQDMASQLLSGVRASLFVAVVAGGGTALVGGAVGVAAGWRGGLADLAVMRMADLLLVIPRLPLLIVAVAYAGPRLSVVAATIAATFWPESARILRAQVRSLRPRAHLRAAVGFGAGTLHSLRRHVVPEVGLLLAAALVAAAGRAVMLEVGLAFLGLGDPNQASWGSVLRDALKFQGLFFTRAWTWWLLPPLVATGLLLLGITLVGLAVDARVNPRVTRHAAGGRR
jgi:peptide/nickel transport system permease protein